MIPDFGLATFATEGLEAAHRRRGEGCIVIKEGTMEGERFVMAFAVGPAAQRLQEIIAANGELDPRSTPSTEKR